jgi:Uma2 family endonuclease
LSVPDEKLATSPTEGDTMFAELLDGTVVITPTPGFSHQDAVLTLAVTLRQACPPGLRVLAAPFAVRLGAQTELRPDLLVARYVDLTSDRLTEAPLLAVEVAGSGTGLVDRSLKKSAYARHRVLSFWFVDPDLPALTAFELDDDGEYVQVGYVTGARPFTASRPFPVTVVPTALVAGLHPD